MHMGNTGEFFSVYGSGTFRRTSHEKVTNPGSEESHHKTEVSRIPNISSPHQKKCNFKTNCSSHFHCPFVKMKLLNVVSPEKKGADWMFAGEFVSEA